MTTLHAFLVSIDQYPAPVPPLAGCVNDGAAFAAYLETWATAQSYGFKKYVLTDAAATRHAVIAGFKHFEAAKSGDVCVFYFSGHGSQMPAPPEFWNESDGLSETLVCYDSRTTDRDLLDKEVAALLAHACTDKEVVFLVVTDCCHSGSATRALNGLNVRSRHAPVSTAPLRTATELWGYNLWVNGLPPVAPHIHLAAAQDDETAKEYPINGVPRGVFTSALIEALQQLSPTPTYADLMDRVGRLVRVRVSNQVPQLNAVGGTQAHSRFLNAEPTALSTAMAYFDPQKGWWLNRGRFHGLPTEGGAVLWPDGTRTDFAEAHIAAFETRLSAPAAATPQAVPVTIIWPDTDKMAVFWPEIGENPAISTALDEAWTTQTPPRLRRAATVETADFFVKTDGETLFLVKKEDTRPLFEPIIGQNTAAATELFRAANHVAQFYATQALHNAVSQLPPTALRLDLYDAQGQPTRLLRQTDADTPVYFQLSVTNEWTQPLFVSVLFCGCDFSVTNAYLRLQKLLPGETAWVSYDNNRLIPNMLPAELLSWSVNEVTENIKVLAATEPLDTDIYNQEGLALAKRVRAIPKPRALYQDWQAFDCSYQLICPLPTVALTEQSAQLGHLKVTLPAGARALAALSSEAETSRTGAYKARSLSTASGVALATGRADAPPMTVLELSNWQGTVSETQPLSIQIANTAAEAVCALAYDPQADMYWPLAVSDASGSLHIAQLPAPTATTRSLTGSIKIFFKKWWVKPLTGDYAYPLLRWAFFSDETTTEFQYISDNQQIKAAVATAKHIVLYIHGIIGDTELMAKSHRLPINAAGKTLAHHYDMALTFDYESLDTPIEQTAFDLEKRLMALGIYPQSGVKIDIVAHSMGGLVSRYFIEKLSGKSVVNRLFMFGTPNQGSEISNLMDWVKKMLTVGVNGAAFWQPYLVALSALGQVGKKMTQTLAQMNPQSDFIQTLNDSPDAHIPYFIVGGNTDLLQTEHPPQYNRLQKVLHHLKSHFHHEMANLWFDAPNDIAVKVVAIRTVGRQSLVQFVEVPGDHLTYFIEKTPSLAQFAAYLEPA